jgi:hypothetical protein
MYEHKRADEGTRDRGTIKNNDRITVTIYSLGIWFVSGICVRIPCIKKKMMMMIIIIIIIYKKRERRIVRRQLYLNITISYKDVNAV